MRSNIFVFLVPFRLNEFGRGSIDIHSRVIKDDLDGILFFFSVRILFYFSSHFFILKKSGKYILVCYLQFSSDIWSRNAACKRCVKHRKL